jgi:hypothetical protein
LDRKRLEDRIHSLLAKAINTTEAEELETVIANLRAALNEHIQRREMAAARPPAPRRRDTD